jgi:hypothetical protein
VIDQEPVAGAEVTAVHHLTHGAFDGVGAVAFEACEVHGVVVVQMPLGISA